MNKILNLDLNDLQHGEYIKFNYFLFPGGEPSIKILNTETIKKEDTIIVISKCRTPEDFVKLCVTKNALDNLHITKHIELIIPYFPGARQDRICNNGEAFTLKTYTDIVNSLNFNKVYIFDSHSDVTPALITNCINIDNHAFVRECIKDIENNGSISPVLISPDAGSNKKILKLAQFLGHNIIVKCDKTRNLSDGNLLGFNVYSENLEGKDCVIVDDICDGGGTFIGLAQELKRKNAGDLYLIISHGIFSKGLKELSQYFKGIYTTNSWRDSFSLEQQSRDNTEIVKIININIRV